MRGIGWRACVLLIGAGLLPGCGQDKATGPGQDGFQLRADSEVAAESVQLHVTLDGAPVRDVDFEVDGGPEHGWVTEDQVFHAPSPLPDPPTSRVTARTRTTPPLAASLLLRLETCGWNIGQLPCALRGHTEEGSRLALEHWAGSMILVSFGATWCAPCREAAQSAEALNQHLKDLLPVPFTQLEVLLDTETVSPAAWASTYGLTFPVLAMDWEDRAYSHTNGINGIPTYVLLTPDFRIRRRYVGSGSDEKIVAGAQAAWREYQAERQEEAVGLPASGRVGRFGGAVQR